MIEEEDKNEIILRGLGVCGCVSDVAPEFIELLKLLKIHTA